MAFEFGSEQSPSSQAPRRLFPGRVLLLVGLLLVILGVKFHLIDRYGSDLPYWDQWDGEGAFLFRPYLEGHLPAKNLTAPHNEHRILFTRLWSLGLLLANDRQWDSRVELVFNAPLDAAAALLLAGFALRVLPSRLALGYAAVVAWFFTTTVSADNTLGAFQSQFYFLTLFAALHLGATLLTRPRSWGWWLAPLAGLAGLFTMASGPFSAMALLGVIGLRVARDRRVTRDDAWVLAANVALFAFGCCLNVHSPANDVLRAPTFAAGLEAWGYQLGWPILSPWAAPLGLCPGLALAAIILRRRTIDRFAAALLGGSFWYWLETAAIAYARGGERHGMESRYADILCVGVLLNLLIVAYLALHASSVSQRRRLIVLTLGFAVLAAVELQRRNIEADQTDLVFRPGINAARIESVRAYVADHDAAFFHKTPWNELPYPSAARLAELLDVPVLRAALPPSVRAPIKLAADGSTTRDFIAYAPPDAAGSVPEGRQAWITAKDWSNSAASANFTSEPFAVDHRRVGLLVAGTAEPDDLQLRMVDEAGHRHEPLGGAVVVTPHWRQINFILPKGLGRFEATVQGGGWFAFTQPATDTALSHFVRKMVSHGYELLILGLAVGLAALAGIYREPLSGKNGR